MKPVAVGVDFGTTNTVVALADGLAEPDVLRARDERRALRGVPRDPVEQRPEEP